MRMLGEQGTGLLAPVNEDPSSLPKDASDPFASDPPAPSGLIPIDPTTSEPIDLTVSDPPAPSGPFLIDPAPLSED